MKDKMFYSLPRLHWNLKKVNVNACPRSSLFLTRFYRFLGIFSNSRTTNKKLREEERYNNEKINLSIFAIYNDFSLRLCFNGEI